MEEEWRDIRGYDGIYQVSNLGKVRRTAIEVMCRNQHAEFPRTYPAKELAIHLLDNGYCQVFLYRKGKSKGELIHRLVAKAFLPNPENKPEVNHIDCNPSNNTVTNLEWCTRLENMSHALNCGWCPNQSRKGYRNSTLHNSAVSESRRLPVKCVETGEIFKSMRAADLSLGVSLGQVSNSIIRSAPVQGYTFVKIPKEEYYEKIEKTTVRT